jgi:CDP-glucose 4,6-dehydratase
MRALANGEAVPVRNPHATRPWQHVLEPLAGYLLLSTRLLDSPARFSGAWNFGPGPESARTVRELVEAVLENWGSGRWVDRGDLQEGAPPEEEFLHLCSDKARMMLGWRPRWDFARSVRETVRWYKAHAEGRDMRRVTENQLEQYISGA